MSSTRRHDAIMKKLHRDGRVEVHSLAEDLGTSEVTIRRDLDQLAGTGVLRRVRGGAISNMMLGEGLPYSMREIDEAEVKERLAWAVSALIREGEALALDSGTTCVEVARALAGRRLTVMPFSVQAIHALCGHPHTKLILPGGAVQPEEGSIVGPLAEASLRAVRFDTAVISPCGATWEDGVTAHDLQDAAVKRGVLDASRRSILVADGGKFSRSAMASVCALSAIDVLVTDPSAPAEVIDQLRAAGVEVIVA